MLLVSQFSSNLNFWILGKTYIPTKLSDCYFSDNRSCNKSFFFRTITHFFFRGKWIVYLPQTRKTEKHYGKLLLGWHSVVFAGPREFAVQFNCEQLIFKITKVFVFEKKYKIKSAYVRKVLSSNPYWSELWNLTI